MVESREKCGWDAIDEAAAQAGGYLAKPTRPLIFEYDYRAMSKYCKEQNISKMELTDEELRMFEYPEPLVYG